MTTVTVRVLRRGKLINSIERPLRHIGGEAAVVYKKRMWRLRAGAIELSEPPIGDRSPPPTAPAVTVATAVAVEPPPVEPDDESERNLIVSAPASARMLVEAGPGTGKTEMAARRLARLVTDELSPGQILVLSFSRSAVRTLTRRIGKIAGADAHVLEELRHVSIRTFDSWAFRILRLLGEDPATLLRRRYDENIAALVNMIRGPRAADVKKRVGNRRHIVVDEFQDLPGVRGELVLAVLELLAPPEDPGVGFTILGDPAQAIFAFAARAGTAPARVTPKEYWAEVISRYGNELQQRRLSVNHRATAPVAALSSRLRVVLLSDLPEEQKLEAVRQAIAALPALEGGLEALQADDEGGSKAILTRTNGEALRVLEAIMGRGVEGPATPIRLRAGSYLTLPPVWIAGLLRRVRSTSVPRSQFSQIYRVLSNAWDEDTRRQLELPEEDAAWMRLARASGAAEDASSIYLAELRAHLSWPDAFPDDQPLADEGLLVTTIHQSKGNEFDVVTLLNAADEAPAREAPAAEAPDDVDSTARASAEEEAFVGYVGLTRAARSLVRSPAAELYKAPVAREFRDGRCRLCHENREWVNLEIGQRGDIEVFSFVDPELHGRAEGVERVQQLLLENARALQGRKVVLCMDFVSQGKAVWKIHLQNEDGTAGPLLGRTAQQLTLDLLHLLHGRKLKLPWRIYNLRISSVGTMTSEQEWTLGEPERTSRLWLGIGLFGTGDFQKRKQNR